MACAGASSGPATFSITVIPAFLALVITVSASPSRVIADELRERRLRGELRLPAGRIGVQLSGSPTGRPPPPRGCATPWPGRGRDPALLGAVACWAFQIGVLWAAFRLVGEPPAAAVMAFFIGMLGNLRCPEGSAGSTAG